MNEILKKIKKGDVVSITGGGGKTSLIFCLAEKLSKQGKVLITTTTKMFLPKEENYEEIYLEDEVIKGKNKNIFIIGKIFEKSNKIQGISLDRLKKLKKEYDYILLEADGAKRKLMKGWNKMDPVIPSFTDIVIGVVNIDILGKKINEENIHRLTLFLDTTQESYEEIIDENVLEQYIRTGSFFKGFEGDKIIFLNGIENIDKLNKGIKLGEKIENLYFGSVWDGWIVKTKKIDAVVMASGYSKRFEGEKLFEEIEGVSLIENSLKKLEDINFNKVMIVGRDDRVEKLAKKYNYEYIENKKAYLGQSESVKIGAANSTGDAIMFFPGDQPFLTRKSILTLIKEYEKNNEIIRPVVNKIPFSPVIFPRKYIKLLLKLEGDNGGKEVIKKANLVCKVDFKDMEEFMDIDTQEELKEVKKVINSKK